MSVIRRLAAVPLACACLNAGPALAGEPAEVPLYMMTMPPHVINTPGRRGMVGDVVLEAMRRAGLAVRVLVEPNPRAMAMVQQHGDAYITALSRTPERENLYTWVAPILSVHRTFYALDKKVGSFADAKNQFRHIAVSRNTANLEILLREGFQREQLVELNAGESAPRMLTAGRVDAWFNMIPESETLLKQIGSPPVARGERLAPTPLYLACSRSCNPDSVRKLVAALAAMKADGSMTRLILRYADEPGYSLE